MEEKGCCHCKELKQGKRLGIAIQNITPDIAQTLSLKDSNGILVAQVEPGSPAENAGLQRGDIIREVNRKPIGYQ